MADYLVFSPKQALGVKAEPLQRREITGASEKMPAALPQSCQARRRFIVRIDHGMFPRSHVTTPSGPNTASTMPCATFRGIMAGSYP